MENNQESEYAQINRLNPGLGGVVQEIDFPITPRTQFEMQNLREIALRSLGLVERGSRWVEFKWSRGSRGAGRLLDHREHTSRKWHRVVVHTRDGLGTKVIKRRISECKPMGHIQDPLERRAVELWMNCFSAALAVSDNHYAGTPPGSSPEEGMN